MESTMNICLLAVPFSILMLFTTPVSAAQCEPNTSADRLPPIGSVSGVCYNGYIYIMAIGRGVIDKKLSEKYSIYEAKDIAENEASLLAKRALAESINNSTIESVREINTIVDHYNSSIDKKSISITRQTMKAALSSGIETVRFIDNNDIVVVGVGIKVNDLPKNTNVPENNREYRENKRSHSEKEPPKTDWHGSGWR
jgi:hypothetical protein